MTVGPRRPPRLTTPGEWLTVWLQAEAVMLPAAWLIDAALVRWFPGQLPHPEGLMFGTLATAVCLPASLLCLGAHRERQLLTAAPGGLPAGDRAVLPRVEAGRPARGVETPALPGGQEPGRDLRGANLWGADLAGASLRRARLAGAWLADADLAGADLRDADLHHAVLTRADLRGADLTGADLRQALLRSADLRGARCDPSTRWPLFFRPGRHGLVRW